ncbi:UxaA family hydrolase [Prosthecomicrobium sp. N25]|uniref:UxaA family hydrolase n=1 Tax=Prosthecomicrobium sp. N25 TaxID=3129254 RepID=UPI00307701A0
MSATDPRLILLSPDDNVLVLRARLRAGEAVAIEGRQVVLGADLGLGHKLARRAIGAGEKILKYGAPIGRATTAIAPGEHVHVHNVASDYTPTHTLDAARRRHGEDPS